MDSAFALVAKGQGITQVSSAMGVSCAQLSLRINCSADWQNGHCNQRDKEADDETLSRIFGIISDMPSDGYRRVWAIMRKQLCDEDFPPVNAKQVYRVMKEHSLLYTGALNQQCPQPFISSLTDAQQGSPPSCAVLARNQTCRGRKIPAAAVLFSVSQLGGKQACG